MTIFTFWNTLGYTNDIKLVTSIENVNWNGISIDQQLLDKKHWNHLFNSIVYNHNKLNSKLKCYVLNESNQDILLDDFKITIIGENKP